MLYISYEKLINNNYHLINTYDELNQYAERDKYFHIYYYKVCYSLSFNNIKKDENVFFYSYYLTNQIFRIDENIVDINDIYIKRLIIPITEYCMLELEFNKNILAEICLYNIKWECNILYEPDTSFIELKKSILSNCIEYSSDNNFLTYCDNLLNKLGSLYLLTIL